MKRYLSLIALSVILIVSMSSFMQLDVATFAGQSTAQEAGSEIGSSCGTDEIINRNPFLQERYSSRVACAPEVDLDTAQVITIPVVMHILHVGEPIGEGTNISDEQAQSCIRNLNERFRGDVAAIAEYMDYDGNPAYDEDELALVIDSKIEFCLASRDPYNLPTTGIIRHDCSDLSYTNNFSGQTSTAYYAEKGISNGGQYDIPLNGIPDAIIKNMFHWPVDKYFNFYVVSEINGNDGGGGIQGYSYVGSLGTGANGYSAGPVCLYNITGDVGTLKNSHRLNATWTHEVGHAFNLYHTFGGAGFISDCTPETNPCSQGDQVPDTPPTSTNTSCNFPNCPDAMLENYMDYTPEICRVAFTQNQIERMRHELWNGYGYLTYNNVSCQSPNDNDLAIIGVNLPSSWCQPTLDFNISVANLGGSGASGATLTINGESVTSLPTIPASESFTVQITDYEIGLGDFDIVVEWDSDDYQDNNNYYAFVEPNAGVYSQVIISPDVWSNELDWEVTNESGEVVMSGGDYPVFSQDLTFEEASCLAEGCYTFKITDSAGDGMCQFDFDDDGVCDGSSDAFINIVVNGNLVFELSDPAEIDFGSELITEFCVTNCPQPDCPADVDGDGVVSVQDLLYMLPYIGMTYGECEDIDLDNDFEITGNDLLVILQDWGLICATGEFMDLGAPPGWVWDYIGDDGDSPTDGVSVLPADPPVPVGRPIYYNLSGKVMRLDARAPDGIYIRVQEMSYGPPKIDKIYHTGGF